MNNYSTMFLDLFHRKSLCLRFFFFLCPFLSFVSCSNPPYRGADVLGADEFVMDSYKIRQGKFSILEMQGTFSSELTEEFLEPYIDIIHEGDLLQITVLHPSRADLVSAFSYLNGNVGFRVSNGRVILPDLEPIEIQGMTLEQARINLQNEYQSHIKDVQLFLSFKDRIERKVELAGLVSTPSVLVDGRIRLFETLAVAKVAPSANFFKSYVIRENEMVPVDLYKLMKNGDMSQNIVMRGGDKVYIADSSDSTIMVLGEVGKEKVVDVPSGFMTLRKALAEAGGIPFTGDKSYIQVIRGNVLHPKIYSLNWQHVIHLPNDSMLLIPGDIVYVAAKPLTEWNRFVEQILPTLIGFDLVTKGVKQIGVNVP
ncbi:MAG: polysaccharide biosynthesis/export family protein [Chlamydiae bacterium]|nr:polysaccharide biosynthesis/export family protein [Chlamydiota bacterium]